MQKLTNRHRMRKTNGGKLKMLLPDLRGQLYRVSGIDFTRLMDWMH